MASVLVADGNRERGEGIQGACQAANVQARRVETGPEALEAALAEVPQLVIAALELPLIDGTRLAEILHANPRTAETRFLFLGRSTARPPSPFDDVLPAQVGPAEIAAHASAMLARQARMDAVRRETVARRELEGQLSELPLVDLIQLLHTDRRTGLVELAAWAGATSHPGGSLWLHEGDLVHASVGSDVQGPKALFRMLGWSAGRFTFSADRRAPRQSLPGPTRALLLEGARQTELAARDASLPALDAEVRLSAPKRDLPQAVHPVTQEVLLLLEMYPRVGDIVEHCSHPDYQVLRTLATLIERGLVVLQRGAAEGAAISGGSRLDPGAARRLQAWLQAGHPPERAPTSAKLILASSDPEASRDFLRLLAPVPGLTLAPLAESGALREDDVAVVATLRFDEGPTLDFLHVPSGEAFAPAWPALAQGALGVLLIRTHPLPEAEARLRPLVQRLAIDPATRLFHVLLLPKGERVGAEEVRARLALLDHSSLFLLPLEGGKERQSLLTTMLTRVLP